MTRASGLSPVLVLAASALASSAAADTSEGRAAAPQRRPHHAGEPSANVSAWTGFRTGVVATTYPSATLGEVRSEAAQARLLRLGAAFHVADDVWVGAHAAYLWAGVEQPGGSYRAASVWGNPILFATASRGDVAPALGTKIDGDLTFGLGVPVAAERGNPYEQLDRRALMIGNALEGMMNPETFTPDVLPLALSTAIVAPSQHFQLNFWLELPLLVRLSDDTIPDGAASSAIGFVPNGAIHGAAWPWRWLGVSLGGSLAWPLLQPVYLSSRRGEPQASVAPRLLFALGSEVLLTLDVTVAAGGPASGTASAALSARLAL